MAEKKDKKDKAPKIASAASSETETAEGSSGGIESISEGSSAAESPSTSPPETADLNAAKIAQLEAEKAQLQADLEAAREGRVVSVESPNLDLSVHCKAFMVYPQGAKARKAGLVPRRIEYASDGGEAVRQYAASYVGTGKEAVHAVSEFTYRPELVMDRRPRNGKGILLFDLPVESTSELKGQIETVQDKEVYYIKENALRKWPRGKYDDIERFRPKFNNQPLRPVA